MASSFTVRNPAIPPHDETDGEGFGSACRGVSPARPARGPSNLADEPRWPKFSSVLRRFLASRGADEAGPVPPDSHTGSASTLRPPHPAIKLDAAKAPMSDDRPSLSSASGLSAAEIRNSIMRRTARSRAFLAGR